MVEAVSQEETLELKFKDKEQELKFNNFVYNALNDRWWCYEHGINYVRPEVRRVEQIVYRETFLRSVE